VVSESLGENWPEIEQWKGLIRFKRLEDVPLEVVGQLIARTPVADYIARIESVFESNAAKRSKSKADKTKR